MSRKLLLLDLVLVALAVTAGFQFRKAWLGAKMREAATLKKTVKPVALPPLPAVPQEPSVVPSNYVDVAAKDLFDPSRNPNVVVEPPPPPPPKPMPALPVYHGMMNLGRGLLAIFSAGPGTPHIAVRPGEQIGQFTLVSVNSDGVTLEWDGKQIYKSIDELMDRTHNQAQQGQAEAEARTAGPAAPATPAAPPPPPLVGPGAETAFGYKTCNMNDGLDAGTVRDGYRKVVTATPFGKSCTWDPVK